MTILLRTPLPDDISALAELCRQLGYPSTPEQVAARLAHILPRPDHAVFLADVDGHPVGWVHICASTTVESDLNAEISGLVVDEAHRNQGIGKALMQRAEDWARQAGIQQLRLRSNIIRKETHQFYLSIGFEIVKTQYTFRKPL